MVNIGKIASSSVGAVRNGASRVFHNLHISPLVKPANLYRGNCGPLILMSEETAAARPSATIRNIINKAPESLLNSDENFDALGLLELFEGQMSHVEHNLNNPHWGPVKSTGINFDIIKDQAKSWAWQSQLRSTHGFKAENGSNWAANIYNRVSNLRFLLKIETPKGQKFWTDRMGEITCGIMTKVSPDALKAIPEEELVKSVVMNKKGKLKWCPADKNKEYWMPYWEYVKKAVNYLSTVKETDSLQDLFSGLKKISAETFKSQ